MKVDTSHVSPNWNHRPGGEADIDTIVLHADGDAKVADAIAYCCRSDIIENGKPRRVSYHTIIGREGDIYSLVPAKYRAWHAGVSAFMGRSNVNDFSVGICFSNRQDGKEPFTEAQYSAGALLVVSTMKAYPKITLGRITTHAEVALPGPNIRKVDPTPGGPFDLAWFLDSVKSLLAGSGGDPGDMQGPCTIAHDQTPGWAST